MPKTILQKIRELQSDPNFRELKKARLIAVDLILTAVNTRDWDRFIEFFVDNHNPRQLARLKLQDDKKDNVYIRRTVAYLLANSMCGADTPQTLHQNIEERLDVGIDDLTVDMLEAQQAEDEMNEENLAK